MKNSIEKIRRRWTQQEWIQEWVNLPTNRKDRVLADLEGDSRQISDYDKELSLDYLTAISALDAISRINQEQNENQAINDIKELLKIIKYNY
ncbi:MAG: hypothetical protein QM493_09110 [Sulfurovum sp.]